MLEEIEVFRAAMLLIDHERAPMNRLKNSVFLTFFLYSGTALCGDPEGELPVPPSGEDPVPGVSAAIIEKEKIPNFKRAALDGDGEAAGRLFIYYYTFDEKEGIYWATIGAENGDITSMYNLGSILIESKESDDRRRAKFWLKKIIKQEGKGYDDYEDVVRMLNIDLED